MLTEEQKKSAITKAAAEEEEKKNQGGFLGGIGYSLEKIGLGFLSGIEGIWDYAAGGLAKLFGADDWAEQQIANDWVNYNHADEWFNPSEGWQFVGDVAGGIGTSLPAIAGVAAGAAIAYFSGGTLTPVAASLIAGSIVGIAGLGAAGRATKEAYDQTGELTGKEFGYGALSGFTEGVMEGVSSAIGAGTGAVVKSISKSFGKEVAKSAMRNTLLKGVVKGFAGEAFEEGVSAMLEPVYKRMTYDPNAKNATFQEVAYAALVGGLSGAIMGGGDVAFRNIRGTTRGNTLVNEGKAGDVITTAEQISSYQTENQTDYETFQVVQNTLDELKTSLQKTDGEVRTVRQKMLLGVLEQANTSAAFEPIVTASAENIYNNAETVASRLNELGYQDQNGKPIQVTPEQIREGIDTTDVKKFRKTMSRALKTNSVLRTLAVADTVGQISMDTARFRDATLAGQQLSTQADLNRFVEQATDAERQAVADRLGIENWETLTNEQFHDKIIEFAANGGVQEYQQERSYVKEAQAVAPEAARKHLPRMVNLRNDGTYRYTQGGTDIAITKRGDSYYVYDYESGLMSKALSRTETNRVLREIHTNEQNYQNGVRQHTEAQNRLREQAAEIDTYARENISEYKNLSAAGQAAIRATIRQGRAAGVQEDFVLSCARVSARSGLRVVFSKEASFVAANGSYADGAIDLKNNRIIINPEAKSRSGESILIHELTHAIYNDTDGFLTVAEGLETMTDAEKEKIRKRYAAVGQGSAVQVSDEINAHFAEQTLSNRNILERLVQKKQTLKEKILGFFKKARADYRGDEKLTGAAARLYRQYKKLFDEFSARNQRYLGTENASAEAQEQAETVNNARNQNGAAVRMAIQKTKGGRNVVVIEDNILEGVAKKDYAKVVRQAMRKFDGGIPIGGRLIKVNAITRNEFTQSRNTQYYRGSDETVYQDKMKAGGHLDEIVLASTNYVNEGLNHARKDSFKEFARGDVYVKIGGNSYSAKVIVGFTGNDMVLYDVVDIQPAHFDIKKISAKANSQRDTFEAAESLSETSVSTNSIAQNEENVNTSRQNNSETDTNRRYALSDSQVEALKKRRVTGNRLLDVSDLADTITEVGGKITADGKAVVYHATNAEAAENIRKTGKMIGKEDNLYFSTKKDGEILGYGDHVVRVQIPLERLELNDIFDNEAHLTMRTRPNTPTNIRFALPELEQEAVKHFGHTYSWAETGYVLTDGSRLDFSGRHEGSGGGGRYEDHRDIAQLDAYSDLQGTDAMIDFMRRGNIRVIPEVDGINLSVRPTRAQENTLADFISRRRGEVTLDIDNERGDTVVSVEYPRGTHSNKVLQDIRNYFDNGTTPTVSEVQRFRYALPDIEKSEYIRYALPDKRTQDILERGETITVYRAMQVIDGKLYPPMAARVKSADGSRELVMPSEFGRWEQADERPDLIRRGNKFTLDKANGSSIEAAYNPYFHTSRSPLNDQFSSAYKRGNLVIVEGEVPASELTSGYRAQYAKDTVGEMRWHSGPVSSKLPKGKERRVILSRWFKPVRIVPDAEVAKTIADMLNGENIAVPYNTVTPSLLKELEKRGVAIKYEDWSSRFALPETDSDGRKLTEQQREFFRDTKVVDENGKLLPVYHGTRNPSFTVFKQSGEDSALGAGIYFAENKEYARGYSFGSEPYQVYLNITNPYIAEFPGGIVQSELIKKGYDGVYNPSNKFWVAFKPEQIKNITNKRPTTNRDIRLALPDTDSTGASLSREQREFFKGSKVVDDKGRLLKVYHGTPRGGFTIFNAQNGAYFTENEAYARRYMQAHNSPTARLIEAYLNITKPFDTRQEAERRIFEREFYRKWGNGTPLSDIGLPDWTDADDLIDFINENGYDYDGLILDEGGDGGYGEAVTRRGVSYVAFSPEQIKLTTNKQPTKDADIRFALSDSVINVDSANETAAWTSERVTDLIDRYGATNPRYTQAYATWINPADFVKATTVNQTRRNQIYDEAGNLDIDRLSRETQTPFLDVDYETMRIVGHEGRHRMAALAKAGVKRVAVAIRFTENSLSRYDARIMDGEHKLKGQTFSSWDADAQRVRTRTSHNSAAVGTLVPINAAYSAQLSEFTSERGVRFALDSSEDGNTQPRGNYSVGQRARFAANNTGMRVYTKAEAAEVINSIIEERLVFEDIGMYGELRGKDRQAVIDYLFQKLNTVKEGYRGGVALKIADFMIEHTVLTDMYAESNGEVSEAMRKLSVLRRYMHKIDLRHIQDEIQYRFDKRNSINLVWGAKEGGIAPDTLPQLLADEGIFIDAVNEADCFLQMVEMYEDARAAVNNATESVMLSTYGDARTIKDLRQQIARDVLNAYEQKGRKSKYAKLVEKYTKQIAELKQRLREANANNRLINSIVDQAQKMRDLKLGTFQNATQYDTEIFRSSIEKLGKIKFRGNFNIAGTRKIMADLRMWYTKENPLLADTYEEGIADMLDEVANGKTNNYTKSELQSIRNIMAYFTNYVEHFNKVYRQGRWVDAVPEATRYIDILHRNEELKSSWFMRKVGTAYLQTFGDPLAVMRRMDRYESGFYTETFSGFREAKIDAEIAKMQLMEEYEAFLKKNKKYLAQAAKETVQYRDVEVPRMHLISLYMTLKRQHAQAGLAENGFGFWNAQDMKVRVDGFAKGITDESELRAAAIEEQARIAELLSETDKEYIAILEKGYQEAGRLKAERDIQRLGFTNATEDYYYPIRRGNIAKNVDSAEMQQELDRISNASFNKDTVRGAKQELYIESADAVFNRHVRGVVQYAYISPAIETYNKLFNLDIAGNPNKPVSVSTESANVWKQGNDYFKKLITDIQGISPVSSEGRAVLSFIRGSYAKFQLGANPKVWVTQLSSLFAASSILDASSIARGMTVSAKDVDIYCPLAKLRAQDNTAAMAQGVLDKVGRVSNALMAPIGKMDRFVVRRLFGACQVQVQKNGGAKVGTETNKIEAGKLLKRVILETQQNSLATERSAAMRSGNEIMRTVTMFSADSMKVIGRVIDSVGELSALKAKLRTTTDTDSRAALQTQIKAARRNVRKSLTALATSALFMAAIAQLFSWLYNKDKDDDETAAQQVLVDFAGNLLGGLPLARDIYSRIVEGYSVDNYAYSALNDLLDSAVNLFDTVGSLVSGDESKSKLTARTKNLLYALGQLTGIPTRNIYNVFYGLTKRFSPTTAYKIDEWFYAKNYVTDLNKAIESDDTDMISMLTSMIFGERMGNTTMSDAVRDKFVDLYSKGYSVLPRSIGDTISYGGVEIPLTDDEYARFRAIYAQSMKDIEKMMNGGAFKVLSEEMQAKAIKQVYDAYYYDALSDLVGVDERTTIGELSKWIDMSKLSVVFTGLSDIESDKNANGATIAGSKKKNTVKYLLGQNLSDGERLLILCYRGYSIQDGDYKGYTAKRAKRILLQYILKLNGTQAEKAVLAEKCGFTVRNGRIIRDF